jgi:hypothetical protein
MSNKSESPRTLRTDALAAIGFVERNKRPIIGSATILATLGAVAFGLSGNIRSLESAPTTPTMSVETLALEHAQPQDILAHLAISNASESLYGIALAAAESFGDVSGPDTSHILESSKSISAANLIQPNSEFALSRVDVDGDDKPDLIVQLAPLADD